MYYSYADGECRTVMPTKVLEFHSPSFSPAQHFHSWRGRPVSLNPLMGEVLFCLCRADMTEGRNKPSARPSNTS